MTVKIIANDKANPPGKLADAELHFTDGPLDGLKLIGFGIWERRTGGGRNVTFPARQYSINGERRSFALLRPSGTEPNGGDPGGGQERIRDLILRAYAEYEDRDAEANAPTGTDYPRVRASRTCPLCNDSKDADLIVCWTCYRSHDIRNGLTPSDAAIIGHAEADLANTETPAAARTSTTTPDDLFGSEANVERFYQQPREAREPAAM